MSKLEEIVGRLLAGGRDPETPAAVVMNGTRPASACVEAPLHEIARRAREAGLGAPAAVVIGDVVRLRESPELVRAAPALRQARARHPRPRQSGAWSRPCATPAAEPVVAPMIRLVRRPRTGPRWTPPSTPSRATTRC